MMTVREKKKKERIEKYRKIHEDILNSRNQKGPIPWAEIAKKYNYKPRSLEILYYARIIPALRKEEASVT